MKRFHSGSHPDPRSILVVLPTWVGDFVMATPMLRTIRTRFAGAHVVFLVEPNLIDLVGGGDWMNEVVQWPAKQKRSPLGKSYRDLVWELRRRRFDWAILLPNSFSSALIALLAGVKRRIGYDRDGRGLLLTDRMPVGNLRKDPKNSSVEVGETVTPGRFIPVPLVEYYADLAEAIDCERPGDDLELFTTAQCDQSVQERLEGLGIGAHHPLVVLSPGAKYGAAKCWAPQRFAALADRLIENDGAAVIITCGPGEESIARDIASKMDRQAFVFDSPLLTLGELKSLIDRGDLLVCNDAGPRHFAKAFGVPVVTIFGPTHPEWTRTGYAAERIVRVDVDCGPCQKRICPLGHLKCMVDVTVDAVYDAARALLDTRVTVPSKTP